MTTDQDRPTVQLFVGVGAERRRASRVESFGVAYGVLDGRLERSEPGRHLVANGYGMLGDDAVHAVSMMVGSAEGPLVVTYARDPESDVVTELSEVFPARQWPVIGVLTTYGRRPTLTPFNLPD